LGRKICLYPQSWSARGAREKYGGKESPLYRGVNDHQEEKGQYLRRFQALNEKIWSTGGGVNGQRGEKDVLIIERGISRRTRIGFHKKEKAVHRRERRLGCQDDPVVLRRGG